MAFNSGKIIAVSNAVKLESDKVASVLPIEKKDNKKEINKDSLAIIYVLKSDVLLRDSAIVEQIIKIIPNNKSVFQEKDSTKLNLIIKSFKSFDEAYPVKKSIESILNKEVEIHAYFAESQIPIEQARKMTQ